MTKPFAWPTPPQFVAAQPAASGQSASCALTLEHGIERIGTLVDFDPAQRVCRHTLPGEPIPKVIPFDEMRSLRLRTPLDIRRPQRDLKTEAPAVSTQSCLLNFKDGGCLAGETVGLVDIDAGLFIYVPLGNDTVECHFFPRPSVRSYQIGERLGELLVEKQVVSREAIEAALKRQETLRSERIGECLIADDAIDQDQLTIALHHQQSSPPIKIGEALRQLELITEPQLQEALTRQSNNRRLPLGEILLEMGAISRDALKRAIAHKMGIPFVDLSSTRVDLAASNLIDEDFVRSHCALPLCVRDGALIVVMDDPLDSELLKTLSLKVKMSVIPVTAERESIVAAINQHYDKRVNATWY